MKSTLSLLVREQSEHQVLANTIAVINHLWYFIKGNKAHLRCVFFLSIVPLSPDKNVERYVYKVNNTRAIICLDFYLYTHMAITKEGVFFFKQLLHLYI